MTLHPRVVVNGQPPSYYAYLLYYCDSYPPLPPISLSLAASRLSDCFLKLYKNPDPCCYSLPLFTRC
jgi:hypothetical protein